MDKQLTITPSERDIEKARAIVNDWYEGWLKCPTWTEAFQRYGAQEISKALAAERASLPQTIERMLKLSKAIAMVATDKGITPITVHNEITQALSELKAWQSGK